MFHYPNPPPGWSPSAADYYSRQYHSMPSSPHYTPYTDPRYASAHPSPHSHASPRMSRRHAHRASYCAPSSGPPPFSVPGDKYGWQSYYEGVPEHIATPRRPEHVSGDFGGQDRSYPRTRQQKTRRPTMPSKQHYNTFHTSRSHRPSVFFDDDRSDSDLDVPGEQPYFGAEDPFYDPEPSRRDTHYNQNQRYKHYQSYHRRHTTDTYFDFNQVPAHVYDDEDTPKRSRARRASVSGRPSQKPSKSTTSYTKTHAKATEADAIRHGVPKGYSIKDWDPAEAPIYIVGSVFDANSAGKWIFDWAVYKYGPAAPMSEMAGDLWLLLIKLTGKVKKADDFIPSITGQEDKEVVEGFLSSGDRLWRRFQKLINDCEERMWPHAKRNGDGTKTMGQDGGCEFVMSMFGRERKLETTEKLIHAIRMWCWRFDTNCETIFSRVPDV